MRSCRCERDPPSRAAGPGGQSPLAAEPGPAAGRSPSGEHSCLISEQECATGSLAQLRHGHQWGCFRFARRNRASRTQPGALGFQAAPLSEKVRECHPPRTPSAHNAKDTRRSRPLHRVMRRAW